MELQNLIRRTSIQRCIILTTSQILNVPVGELRINARAHSSLGAAGSAADAANRLGMKRTTLHSRMKKLKISPPEPWT
jgi:transcriptional regulator of acetoin/glycerol metabolism